MSDTAVRREQATETEKCLAIKDVEIALLRRHVTRLERRVTRLEQFCRAVIRHDRAIGDGYLAEMAEGTLEPKHHV